MSSSGSTLTSGFFDKNIFLTPCNFFSCLNSEQCSFRSCQKEFFRYQACIFYSRNLLAKQFTTFCLIIFRKRILGSHKEDRGLPPLGGIPAAESSPRKLPSLSPRELRGFDLGAESGGSERRLEGGEGRRRPRAAAGSGQEIEKKNPSPSCLSNTNELALFVQDSVSLSLRPGWVCAVTGAVGTGKVFSVKKKIAETAPMCATGRASHTISPASIQSTLLQAVLGEVPVLSGCIQTQRQTYAAKVIRKKYV